MLRAVFVRTLKPGVTIEEFMRAWVPEDAGGYPAKVSVSRNVADEHQVITVLELDMSLAEFQERRAELTRPDSLDRLAEIVRSTEVEGLYEEAAGTADL